MTGGIAMSGGRVSLRSLPVLVAGITATVIGAAWLLFRNLRREPAVVDRATRWWAGVWLRAAGARLSVSGLEHVQPGRAYLVVSNHQSNLDPMAHLRALPLSLRFLAKRELFRTPLLGPTMRAADMVEVDRSSPDRRRIDDDAARHLRDGQSLLVYPEGTTSADGTIGLFKTGAFLLAITNQVPILPVAIHGTGRIWPGGVPPGSDPGGDRAAGDGRWPDRQRRRWPPRPGAKRPAHRP